MSRIGLFRQVSKMIFLVMLARAFTTTRTTALSSRRPNTLLNVGILKQASAIDSYPQVLGNVTILERTQHYVVVDKPPSVVCHHSDWTGSRSRNEVPMLQRTREALGGQKVNLVHRLDRGCSGCLLMTYASSDDSPSSDTKKLIQAMADSDSTKTYVAIVRGEGILHGRDLQQEGWFKVDRPIKDERGHLNNATTWFRFVAGQHNGNGTIDRPRASIVLARPETGRWHQIRRHLNGLSHPILGDTSHGNSKVNREWRSRGMLPERTCLHLACLNLTVASFANDGVKSSRIEARSPIAQDMISLLRDHLPAVFQEAMPILKEEGVLI